MDENPILNRTIPAVFQTTTKTTIHWSRLDQPDLTANKVQEQVAGVYRELLETPKSVVFIDTETTGADKDKDQPVEIAVIDGTGEVLFNRRVKPTIPISPGATEVHGISIEDLADAPSFAEVVADYNLAVEGKQVVVYNAAFDRGILLSAAKANSVRLDNLKNWHCAMLDYAEYNGTPGQRGGAKWWKLADACANEGVVVDGTVAHTALGDCQRTRGLMQAIVRITPIPIPF